MTRLFEDRQRRQWETARALAAGTSAGRPEPVDWGQLVGLALIGGAAYVVLKEQQAKSRAPASDPALNPSGGSFVFAQVRQPSSFVDQVMEWTSNHTPHLAAAAAGYELIKDPTLLRRTLEAAMQPRALAPPVAEPVARTIPVIRSIATPIQPVRITPR